MSDIKLLDCTLRDGGYINDWNWGFSKAKAIIDSLVKANVDIIEIGFLRNVQCYNKNITVCNKIEELKELIPKNYGDIMFSAMAMQSNYDIEKLSDWKPSGIDMIRITAHDYDIREGMKFAQQVQQKGYKLSINPINIMGYSDDEILWIVEQVNAIMPYQFSIVDTFGSMKEKDLVRIVGLVDHNLDQSVRLGLHLHENMAQSFSLAKHFLEERLNRPVTVDASLMGMGRIPGNLSIELIAEYLNENFETSYNLDYIMDSIHDYIEPIKKEKPWGYSPTYFLSAKYNLHRNYAEFYLNKGDLTIRDINHVLARVEKKKKTAFDEKYAENLYEDYQSRKIDDVNDREGLKKELFNRKLLVLAPGESILKQIDQINKFIIDENPIVIALNFVPDSEAVDYVFFSNSKRYKKVLKDKISIIATSNLNAENAKYHIDFNSISGAFTQGCNSLILLLSLLKQLNISKISLAGADGYKIDGNNYYDPTLMSATKHDREFNQEVAEAIKKVGVQVNFITTSEYQKYI